MRNFFKQVVSIFVEDRFMQVVGSMLLFLLLGFVGLGYLGFQ